MKELGLQIPVNKIYNPKKPSLSDAVVSFGGFCSGVVVSEDGLVFTNHHCGFSSIQQHSSVEHDYLKERVSSDYIFYSQAFANKVLSLPGLSVCFCVGFPAAAFPHRQIHLTDRGKRLSRRLV